MTPRRRVNSRSSIPKSRYSFQVKTPVPPIDYEGIMKAYAAGNHDNEEEAEFSGSDGDDSSSSSSDELDEKHDPDAVSTAMLLQEVCRFILLLGRSLTKALISRVWMVRMRMRDVDDRGFLPRKVQVDVWLGTQIFWVPRSTNHREYGTHVRNSSRDFSNKYLYVLVPYATCTVHVRSALSRPCNTCC